MYDFRVRVYHLSCLFSKHSHHWIQLCHPSLCPPMPWALPFSPTSLPSHTSLLDIDLMESPACFPRCFLQCLGIKGLEYAYSFSATCRCPRSYNEMSHYLLFNGYFISFSPFSFPCLSLFHLYFPFSTQSPPHISTQLPYFTVSISKFSISDAITYAISTLHGTNGLVS